MRLLRPPSQIDDPDRGRAARLVHALAWIGLAAGLLFFLSEILLMPGTFAQALLAIGLVAAAGLFVLWLNDRGQVRAASVLLVAGLWCLFAGLTATRGGVAAPFSAGFLVAIFIAGFLLGAAAAWLTAAASALAALALVVAELRGWLPPSLVSYSPATYWAVLVFFMLLAVGQQQLAARVTATQAASEKKFRALFAAMLDVILVLDRDGRFIEVAPTSPNLLYRPAPELLGRTVAEIFPPPLANFFQTQIRTALAAGQPHTFDYQLPIEEHTFWFTATLSRLSSDRLLLVARDVTARKQAEADLRNLSRVVEQAADSVVITDRAGCIVYVNPAFERQTGYTAAEALGQTPRILKSGQHPASFYERLWRTILAGDAFQDILINRRKDGTLLYEEKTITPLRDEQGAITRFVATAKDVTERWLAEEARRQSEQMFRTLIEAAPIALVVAQGPELRVVYANARFTEVFGYTLEEIPDVAHWWPRAYPDPVYRAKVQAEWSAHWQEAQLLGTEFTPMTADVTGKNGLVRHIEFRLAQVGDLSLVFFGDLTQRHVAEESLRRTQAELEARVRARTLELSRTNYSLIGEINERAAAEGRLRAFAAALPDTAFIVDPEGRFEDILTATSPVAGQSPSAVQGRHLADFLPEDLAATFLQAIRQTLATGETQIVEYALPQAIGMGWFEGRSAPLVLGGGSRPLVAFVVRDISARKQAELARAESEARLRAIFETSNTGIFFRDHQGAIIFANEAYARLLGYTREELNGVNFSAYLPSDSLAAERVLLREIETGQRDHYRLEKQSIAKNGRPVWVDLAVAVVRTAQGTPRYYVGTVTDINERKRVEATVRAVAERLTLATEAAAIGIWQWTPSTNELLWDDRMFAIYGAPRDQPMVYETWKSFVLPEDFPEQEKTLQRTVAGKGRSQREFRILRGHQTLRHIQSAEAVTRDVSGSVLSVVGVNFDITDQRLAEQTLKSVLADLERSNNELKQFAYIASHDLQEPLRLVSSYVQLLAQRYQGRLGADADEFIGYAVDGAKRMQTLIQDLLAYSRVGREARPLAPVDCNVVLAQVVQTLRLTIRDQQAAVTYDPLPTVPGDATQLGQLFQNLVANALKFRRAEPPRVHVTAELAADQRTWQFAVRDNGIGIDAEFYERIFVIFQRLHGRGKYPGSGIGLSICRKIVELHGGRIWVESVKDQGTTFYFTLPAA
jgi:PAS domain S-box-containing protein